ncbi:uncharacterized protein PAC_11370 [Phialocephala subalpina]|uniref:Uncharacterized protein n=1 Tax=Phialocephala subalpina TaxID=576137 RepID=A0A1L7X8X9_9HELO|nr:uncharacterized protein PAC_11370 [Phialocephala subalpina]
MAQYAPENVIVDNQPQVPLVRSALNFIRTSVPTWYDAINTGAAAYLYLNQLCDRRIQQRVNEQLRRDQAEDREEQRIINERLRNRRGFNETCTLRRDATGSIVKYRYRSSHIPIAKEHRINQKGAVLKAACYGTNPGEGHPAVRRRRGARPT